MMVYFKMLWVQFQATKAFSQGWGEHFAYRCSATVVGYINLDPKP